MENDGIYSNGRDLSAYGLTNISDEQVNQSINEQSMSVFFMWEIPL
jgi:hypothetical protein